MNIRALRLPILFTGFILSVLVSLSAFSMSARAEVLKSFPMNMTQGNQGFQDLIITGVSPDAHFLFAFNWRSVPNASNDRVYQVFVFDNRTPFTCSYRTWTGFYDSQNFTADTSIVVDGVIYWYYTAPINGPFNTPRPEITYDSISAAISDGTFVPGPEFADFGFNNIQYTPYINPTGSLLFDAYRFENLSYLISWQGSTNPEFPITSYNYELYGFSDSAMSNTDKSNGELVDSGTHTVPNVFAYEVPYGSLTDFFGGMKYDKVVLYLTPFSNITEGNTFYIVLNIVRNDGFSVSLGPFDINAGGSVKDIEYGDGVLPVPQTDVVQIDDNQYYPVGYIDQTPIVYAIKTTSGTYNNHYDIYRENISYAPVVYGDTFDNSQVINNNQTYNNIINNINGTLEIDPDSSGAADSIVSFLSLIVMFFQTCWTYFIQGFLFFPDWVNIVIVQLMNLLGSIVVALGIIKILRGIF